MSRSNIKKSFRGNLLLGQEWVEAEVCFDERIQTIQRLGAFKEGLPLVMPGFVDLHLHGGGGADIMDGGQAIEVVARTHARYGTTSFLATTMTAPFDDLEQAFRSMQPYFKQRASKGARLLGVHLEGPFISKDKLGAQPDYVRAATLKEIQVLHAIVPIKVITLAPEVFNHLELIQELVAMGIVVQIGHTNGSYEEGLAALEQGARSFTHLFNAMSSFHHRSPGMVGAALAHANYAEIIPDLLHVHPGAIRSALRAIPQIYFVTDATAATGMPDGEYHLGKHRVHKCLGGVKLADGTLAGSALTMDQALRNLHKIGLALPEASRRLSGLQSELLGLSDRGLLREHAFADFVIVNSALQVEKVFVEGELV